MHHHRFQDLPESIRHSPAFMAWLLMEHEGQLAELQKKPDHHQFHMEPIQTPLGKLPLPLAVAIGGWLMWRYPDKVAHLFGL